MVERSLADSPHQSTTEGLEHVSGIAARVLRGQRLFRDHAEAFMHKRGTWYVPSDSGTSYYAVRLGPVETCECSDFEYRGSRCKHIHAASIAQAKSAPCSCCGQRVLNRFLSEVTPDDNLLAWFPGDLICADCIHDGHFV